MANPDFNLCDGCGAHVPQELRFFVATERGLDAAGSNETTGEHADLCNRCSVIALRLLLRLPKGGLDFEAGRRVLDWIKNHGRKS
jgi:hypothetical protein